MRNFYLLFLFICVLISAQISLATDYTDFQGAEENTTNEKTALSAVPDGTVSLNLAPLGVKQADINSAISSGLQLQLPFIKNEGQLRDRDDIKFYTQTFQDYVFITETGELVYQITQPKEYIGPEDVLLPIVGLTSRYVRSVKERPVTNVERRTQIEPLDPSETYVNYIGEIEYSRDNILTYNRISLGEVWHGITFQLKANQYNIEKVFIVQPQGEVSSIHLSIEGATDLSINERGELVLSVNNGGAAVPHRELSFTKPYAYQIIDGIRHEVEVSYVIIPVPLGYGFNVGDYNKDFPLIIDPLLASSYIGSTALNSSNGIARDSNGNVFIVGYTSGPYPTTGGAYQTAYLGGYEAIITKFNPGITGVLASTLLGPAWRSDLGLAIAVDSSNNIFIIGSTGGGVAPPATLATLATFGGASFTTAPATTGAYDTTFNYTPTATVAWDVFVARLNNNLTSAGFVYTFLGGGGVSTEIGIAIAIDRQDNVFVCGYTGESGFPVQGAAYTTYGGGTFDGFITRFNNNLTAVNFSSSFLGGTLADFAFGLTIDSSNRPIIVGSTSSPNFPVTPGVYDITLDGFSDAFISMFSNTLSNNLSTTLLGGPQAEAAYAVVVDTTGNIVVTGETGGFFPISFSGISTFGGGTIADAFVARLNPTLRTLLVSRYLGGSGNDFGWSLATMPFAGEMVVGGTTYSTNFPASSPAGVPLKRTLSGTADAFITRLDYNFNIVASTYLGGSGAEAVTFITTVSDTPIARMSVAVDSACNILATGNTTSPDFPVTNTFGGGATYPGPVGQQSIFISRITPDLRGGSALTTAALAPPILRTPLNRATYVALPPILEWSRPTNVITPAVYTVYFGTTSYPLTSIYSGGATRYELQGSGNDSTYYWYVVASDASGRISWSDVWRFGTEPDPLLTSGSSGGPLFGEEAFTKPLGTCFIATAVYGSETHPDVLVLRNFRDNYLLTNKPGKAFVKLYYRFSPPVAERLKQSPTLSAMSRVLLTPIVRLIEKVTN
ncbi:MAG: SBBP repeat-containing protein [Planctomycetota bacterium]|nr:SBBP repeat-containing protein [Planctomycetota bacterium]